MCESPVIVPSVVRACSVQIRSYDAAASASSGGLKPRRMLVWEGRRKGCPGVGWGTGSLIAEGIGQGEFAPAYDGLTAFGVLVCSRLDCLNGCLELALLSVGFCLSLFVHALRSSRRRSLMACL